MIGGIEMRKEYKGMDFEVVLFGADEVIVASGETPATKPEIDITQDPDDLPIL